jgi:hypothetical protein
VDVQRRSILQVRQTWIDALYDHAINDKSIPMNQLIEIPLLDVMSEETLKGLKYRSIEPYLKSSLKSNTPMKIGTTCIRNKQKKKTPKSSA